MTHDQVIALAKQYADELKQFGDPRPMKGSDKHIRCQPLATHILYMCNAIPVFVRTGKVEKAMRWLGFVQGWFATKTWYSINELKQHNKSERSEHGISISTSSPDIP